MTIGTKAQAKTAPAFPTTEIEGCIREYLKVEGADQAKLHGDLAVTVAGEIGPQPEIDSLVVVAVLCELEPKVPFDLPDRIVRGGGYDSVDDTVQHLMPQIQEMWRKHYEGSK